MEFSIASAEKKSNDIFRERYPLHCVCRDGDLLGLSCLLEDSRHDIYVVDSLYGWTPIHWAAYFGRLSCLMYLLEKGISCDITTASFLQTPAHMASFAGHGHCLKWLLHCGASIDKQDYLKETPLHKAARTGCMECISLLTSHGANLHIKNSLNQSVTELAWVCNQEQPAHYLQRLEEIETKCKVAPFPSKHSAIQSINEGLNGGHIPQGFTIDNDLFVKHNNSPILPKTYITNMQQLISKSKEQMMNFEMQDCIMDTEESFYDSLKFNKQLNGFSFMNDQVHFGLDGFAKKRLSSEISENDIKRGRRDDEFIWETNYLYLQKSSLNHSNPVLTELQKPKPAEMSNLEIKDINAIPGKCYALRGHYL